MSRDFEKLIADIEAEAHAEGPEAVAQMRTYQTRFRLASQLISMRKARGWSQERLAELTGIGQPEISNFERGLGSPTEVTLTRLIAPFEYHIGFVPDSVDEREFVPA